MAVIEGFAMDIETGKSVFYGVIQIHDELDRIVATTGTDMKGEFHVEVPAGVRYKICLLTELFQPICPEILDDDGNWTPLTEEGRRVRLNTKKMALAQSGVG